MSVQEKFNERIEIFQNAVRMDKKPSRTPFVTNDAFWRYYDLGYKLSEAIVEPEIIKQSLVDFQKRYNFDLILDNGDRNPMKMTRSLGNFQYGIDDENNTLIVTEQCHFYPEDYDKFMQNPIKTLWEDVLPRKYTYFTPDMELSTLQNTLGEFLKYDQQVKDGDMRLINECGVPPIYDPVHGAKLYYAVEALYNFWRGMKGLSRDVRTMPDKVEAFLNFFHNISVKPSIDAMTHADNVTTCFTAFGILLSQNMFNAQQFGRFVWPHMKESFDKVVETDNTMYILSEGTTMHITDYLQDLPKGHFCFYVESDDIFERRKSLPNLCLWGGIPAALISKGSKEECVDYAKKVIDEVGANGGLVLCTDRFTSSPRDCKRENLLAVSELVYSYK